MAYPDNVIPVHLVDPPGTAFTRFAFRYDTGMVLLPLDRELPHTYQVDFANDDTSGTSITQIGDENGVSVPSQFFEDGANVWAFIWLTDGNSGYTRYKVCVSLIGRPERTNEEPTPEEQSAIDQAIAALNDGVGRAEAAASLLENPSAVANTLPPGSSATAAYSNGTFTFGIPRGDQGEQGIPGQDGQPGQDGKDGKDGTTPDISIGDVTTLPAGSSATASITGTTEAPVLNLGIPQGQQGQQGETGQTGATGATPDLSIGTVLTLPAGSSATATITGTPENPVLNLGIPKGDTGEVSQADLAEALLDKADVITDTASGSIVSIPDGMSAPAIGVEVEIEPVQDLHGYDNPWPAGGGKNKLGWLESGSQNISASGTVVFSKDTSTFSVENALTSSYGFRFGDKCKVTLSAGTYYLSSNLTGQVIGAGVFVYNTSTAAILARARAEGGGSFTLSEDATVALGMSLTNGTPSGTYYFQLELGSTATSYSPYSNICPISGWTGCEVTRTGKNIFGGNIVNGHTRFDTKAGQTYIVSAKRKASNDCYLHVESSDNDFETMTLVGRVLEGQNSNKVTFAAQQGLAYSLWSNSSYAQATDVQIELGSTATTYTPYTGTTYPISWQTEAGTVYGGTLDVTSGVLRVTHGIENDLGNMTWTQRQASPSVYYHAFSSARATVGEITMISSALVARQNTDNWSVVSGYSDNSICIKSQTNNVLAITDSVISDASALAEKLSGVQLVYELATPIEVSLTPTEIQMLKGTNNIWADTGDTSLEYRCDTKAYILKKIAEALNA